ncbi:MAG: hypothetical protein H7A25_23690 [Leptospiraceae bacterium]|nr:hypothetical protein [Leptospiraceae bacterium]
MILILFQEVYPFSFAFHILSRKPSTWEIQALKKGLDDIRNGRLIYIEIVEKEIDQYIESL